MFDHAGKITPEFKKSTDEKQTQKTNQAHDPSDQVPDIIKQQHNFPEPRPNWDTADMFKEQFEQTWQEEIDKRKQPDAFDQIDVERQWSERLGRSLGNERK